MNALYLSQTNRILIRCMNVLTTEITHILGNTAQFIRGFSMENGISSHNKFNNLFLPFFIFLTLSIITQAFYSIMSLVINVENYSLFSDTDNGVIMIQLSVLLGVYTLYFSKNAMEKFEIERSRILNRYLVLIGISSAFMGVFMLSQSIGGEEIWRREIGEPLFEFVVGMGSMLFSACIFWAAFRYS